MSRGARAVRGTAVAVFATFVASLAHTLGGGSPPAAVALMVALAFSVPFAMALSGGRAPVMRTAVSALVAQAALHLTYSLGGAAPLDAAKHAGHDHAGVHLSASTVVGVDHGTVWMPVAHLLAAVLTLAALMLGDGVLDALGRAVRVLVRRLTVTPAAVAAPLLRVPVEPAPPHYFVAILFSGLGSRGPPVGVAAA